MERLFRECGCWLTLIADAGTPLNFILLLRFCCRYRSFKTRLAATNSANERKAQEVLEAARLELHSYCALAPEGDLLQRQRTLAGLVNVPELEEFLRKSGNLKKELDYVSPI